MMTNLGIVDTKKLIAALNEALGINYADYSLTTLRRRFVSVLTNFNISNVDDFITQLKKNNLDSERIFDLLMIDSTEIFRDPSLWREMRERYLPEISKTPGSKIWVPGVSSGEELYSLMVLIRELGIEKDVRVVASCNSKYRINRIKEGGGYPLKRMEIGEANYTRLSGKFEFDKYFEVRDNKIYMDSSLVKDVEFNEFNISQQEPTKTYRMVIFRNVLLQYNLPLYEKVVRKLRDSLTVGGYLFLGNKETLEHSESGKKMQLINELEKVYRKRV